MASNICIEHVLKDIPTFLGIYSSDTIPIPSFYPSSCILNFSSRGEIGTHFVTLLYSQYYCTYFNPLNMNFIPEEIEDFMQTHFFYNIRLIKFKIQHDLSNFCGLYCMFVCMLHYYNKPILLTLQNTFPMPDLTNDNKIVKLLYQIFERFYISG